LPTASPSVTPSKLPSSTIPSAQPTITGEIINVMMVGTVDQELTSENITAIRQTMVDLYGVNIDDVEIETKYTTSGQLSVDIPRGVSEEQALAALQE
jgi:hypothetical protein